MGEKSGSMTNMIIVIVALVAIVFIVHRVFPDIATSITNKMKDVINNTDKFVNMALPSTFLFL